MYTSFTHCFACANLSTHLFTSLRRHLGKCFPGNFTGRGPTPAARQRSNVFGAMPSMAATSRRVSNSLPTSLVVVGACIVTSLGINNLNGISGTSNLNFVSLAAIAVHSPLASNPENSGVLRRVHLRVIHVAGLHIAVCHGTVKPHFIFCCLCHFSGNIDYHDSE